MCDKKTQLEAMGTEAIDKGERIKAEKENYERLLEVAQVHNIEKYNIKK